MRGIRILFIAILVGVAMVLSAWAQEGEKEFKKSCRGCHGDILEKWDASPVKHFPYEKQKCESCHAAEHKKFTAEKDKPCAICHSLDSEKIKKSHFSLNLAGADCFSCHYVHGAPNEGMLKEVVHMPFEAGMCDACHSVDPAGKIQVKENIHEACFVCHSEIQTKEGETIHPALEMGECNQCHNPHTSPHSKLLNQTVSETCFNCHSEDQAKKHPFDVVPSEKIALQADLTYEGLVTCVSCHNPHKAKFPFLMKETLEGQKACSQCHQKETK